MISMGFVEQPKSASTRYETSNQTRTAAVLPRVIGGPGAAFNFQRRSACVSALFDFDKIVGPVQPYNILINRVYGDHH
jgi:hypothetical protein